jgi:hypothetical protein
MRHQVTFILRLWVNPDSGPTPCEGQVECVATGEQAHVRSQAEAARFILRHLNPSAPGEQGMEDDRLTCDGQ